MEKLLADIQALGSAATRSQLRTLGWSHRAIRQAVADERVIAFTRSWVGSASTPAFIALALGMRGLVGGAAALRTYGVWVAETPHPVVSLPRKRALPTIPSGVGYCRGDGDADARFPWRVGVVEALAQYVRSTREYWAVAAVDSALNKGVITKDDLGTLASSLNREQRRWLRRVNRRAESGLESILRLACLDQGWTVEVQVTVPGGRVDLVINGWLFIEIDGSEFHDLAEQAKKDRARNNVIVRMGYRWHRFGYRDIRHDLDRSIETIRRILRQGSPTVRVTKS
ncbi:DUF559 domain-containing protein [uncultured Agrococcus sp.]|uniref:endonuclease domain-containing protein n=1 Tax=uncultured Agrococcus sp. TaxID=382258 RepID=UPI0025E7706F|nr:DUF559 domain-containing protein [uncultured Agrococcus sp.]